MASAAAMFAVWLEGSTKAQAFRICYSVSVQEAKDLVGFYHGKKPISQIRQTEAQCCHSPRQVQDFNAALIFPCHSELDNQGPISNPRRPALFERGLNQLRGLHMSAKVLLIDDDAQLGRLIDIILRPIGIALVQVQSGLEGLKTAYTFQPDLVILDISMPEMDGFEVCVRLREISDMPILILTARTSESDMVRAFNMGADDFVKKPFNKSELEVRVRALLRRATHRSNGVAIITSYRDAIVDIDLCNGTVKLHGKTIALSPREFSLLAYLIHVQGKVATYHELTQEVWGEYQSNAASIVALNICNLRRKLRDGQFGHRYIRTNWGRGYWFEPYPEDDIPAYQRVPKEIQIDSE